MMKEFLAFLKEYSVVGLAIAVVIGGKVNALVTAIVEQLVMPFIGILVPGGNWRMLTFQIGNSRFGVGVVLGAMLDFTVVAFVVFSIAKYILKQEKVEKFK